MSKWNLKKNLKVIICELVRCKMRIGICGNFAQLYAVCGDLVGLLRRAHTITIRIPFLELSDELWIHQPYTIQLIAECNPVKINQFTAISLQMS